MSKVSASRCDGLKLLVVNNKIGAIKIIIIVYSMTDVAINQRIISVLHFTFVSITQTEALRMMTVNLLLFFFRNVHLQCLQVYDDAFNSRSFTVETNSSKLECFAQCSEKSFNMCIVSGSLFSITWFYEVFFWWHLSCSINYVIVIAFSQQTHTLKNDKGKYVASLNVRLLAHLKWRHGSILCQQIPTNDCGLK